VLIAAKANVAYAEWEWGETALHLAACQGQASMCRMLIDEGALPTALNRENRTPLEVAKARGHAECVAILEAPPATAAAAEAEKVRQSWKLRGRRRERRIAVD